MAERRASDNPRRDWKPSMRYMSGMEDLLVTQNMVSDVPPLTAFTGNYDGSDHEQLEHAKRLHTA